MSINNSKRQKFVITKDHRILAKNSFYSFLNTYGSFFFSTITSFLLARLIKDVLWGYLVLALSSIAVINLILSFFPPGLDDSLNYYIPKYLALNKKSELKYFFKSAIYFKLIFLIPYFILNLVIISFFKQLFAISLREYTYLLLILSPLVIILSLEKIFYAIYRGLNKFNIIFILLIVRYSFNITALIFCFFLFSPVNIEIIAYIDLFSFLIPFLLNCIFILKSYFKINVNKEKKQNFKIFIKKSLHYGGPIRLGRFFTVLWGEIQTQSVGIFNSSQSALGLNISKNYTAVSSNMTLTFSSPLTISFTRLSAKENTNQINKLYNMILIYSMVFLTFITGILYYFADFFIFFIYGESYLIYSPIIKLFLFTIIFLGTSTPYNSLMLAMNKVKWVLILRVIAFAIRVPLFLILVIYLDLFLSIFGIIISNIIISIIALIFSVKIGKISLNFKKLLKLLLAFFLSLIITWILEFILIEDLNYLILQQINLLFFRNLNLISIGLFILLFFILILIFKIFTNKDLEYIEAFFDKNTKLHIFIRKGLNLFKKVVRD